MAIENERKIVLNELIPDLERRFLEAPGVVSVQSLRQGYLNDESRLRHIVEPGQPPAFIFTFKRGLAIGVEELEFPIEEASFQRLWPTVSGALEKTRIKITDRFDLHWDIDFLKHDGQTYFAMAEVEMPVEMMEPPALLPEVQRHTLHIVERDDLRFTNRKLTDRAYAIGLLAQIRNGTLPHWSLAA
jgi:hypothetical protein